MKTLRQLEILSHLIESREFLSSTELSSLLGVSYKTIQNDLSVISGILEDFDGVILESKRGLGYILRFNSDNEKHKLNEYVIHLKNIRGIDNQLSILFISLMFRSDSISKEDLLHLLDINEKSFNDVFLSAKEFAESFHLNLEFDSQSIHIFGNEIYKRMLFMNIYANRKDNMLISNLINENAHFIGNDFSLLNSVERQLANFSTDELHLLSIYELLTLKRQHQNNNVDPYLLQQLSEYYLPQISNITVFSNEDENLLYSLILIALDQNSTFKVVPKANRTIYPNVHRFFVTRLTGVQNLFVDFKVLEERVLSFISFLSFQNLLGFRPIVLNDFFDNEDFTIALEIASHLVYTLKSHVDFNFTKENIYQLAFVFLKQFKYSLFSEPLVIDIYSHKSHLISYTLKREITKKYGDTVEISVLKETPDFQRYLNPRTLLVTDKDFDILKTDAYFSLFISNLLQDSQLSQLIKMNIRPDFIKNQSFLESFRSNNFSRGHHYKNIGDVLKFAMIKNKVHRDKETTIRNIFFRERHNFSLSYNGLSVPRIFIENLDSPYFEVVIPKKPLVWNDKYIKIMFILFLPRDFKGLTIIGEPLNQLYNHRELIDSLSEAEDFISFFEILKSHLYTEKID